MDLRKSCLPTAKSASKVLTEAQLSGSLQTGQSINNLEKGTLLHKEGDGLYGLRGLFHLPSL